MRALPRMYRGGLVRGMGEVQARERLALLWTIQAAISPRGGRHGDGALHFELNLIDQAFASDPRAHGKAYEAACRGG